MNDIFLSYARTDMAIASMLAKRLRREGWSVFMDIEAIPVGERWDKAIEKELSAARAIVVLWSARSIDRDIVLEEARRGLDKNILFPAFIEQVTFPMGFSRIQTASMVGWMGDEEHPGLTQLLHGLMQHLNGDNQRHEPIPLGPLHPPFQNLTATPGRCRTFRDQLRLGGEGPMMVTVPAGRFTMGWSQGEPPGWSSLEPQHEVWVAYSFAMSAFAVTFEEYDRFVLEIMRKKPQDEGWGRGKRPVINVSWEEALEYCAWLSERTGHIYRLPSEAEWEYACRAGTTTPFYFGERISTEQANFDGNFSWNGSPRGVNRSQTLPVGTFPPNAYGLYDMHGNVWEWCQDAWYEGYNGAPRDGTAREDVLGLIRTVRGGSWQVGPDGLRASGRKGVANILRRDDIGFRVCCDSRD
jgi:formylglycine-generating enzyme required for sulfatase activity